MPETDLRLIIEDFVKDGNTVVVQSLVLQINSSCPVFVSGVNDDECHLDSTSSEPSSVAVIVGGAFGGTIGVVLVIGVVIIVTTKVIARHRQAMAKMQNEARYLDYNTMICTHATHIKHRIDVRRPSVIVQNEGAEYELPVVSGSHGNTIDDLHLYEYIDPLNDKEQFELSQCPAYLSVSHTPRKN